MILTSLLEQTLNGLQFGVTLFLLSAGLTLVFGVMNFVNMAQGSLYMIGAYLATTVFAASGSFIVGLAVSIAGTAAVAALLEVSAFRRLYEKDHLSHLLGTFGVVLFFNELVRVIWGSTAVYSPIPAALSFRVHLLPGLEYPAYRLAIIVVGVLVAGALYLLISHSRVGMLIRAGATDRQMIGVLGVNIRLVNMLVFAFGGALTALAGAMVGPISAVQPGMGESILILIFVVIVIGGIGSVRGAFFAALLIGLVDTMGRAFMRPLLGTVMPPNLADAAGPGLASVSIYVVMALVLFLRPQGLFAGRST